MPKRAWVRYIEERYGVALHQHVGTTDLEGLIATQSEIEQIKYDLVRHEAFREGEPILVYRSRLGESYIVDGHTRARVQWDLGRKTIAATVCTSPDAAVDAELFRIAADAGGGRARPIAEVPIVDRVGRGTDAWKRQRQELLANWKAEGLAADETEGPG